MQTNLEKYGIEARKESINRNNTIGNAGSTGYNKNDKYSSNHKNSLGGDDIQGKGTGHGGHTHVVPNSEKPRAIDYSTFDTSNGGNKYDINGGYEGRDGGRNYLKTISLYSEGNEYGAHLIDTTANQLDDQIIM